jgi:hypothetical protein
MVNSNSPALWAVKRALEICCDPSQQEHPAREAASGSPVIRAFAHYIETHEAPPPDPLLDEARDVIARCQETVGMAGAAKATRQGKCDNQMSMRFTLEAIRRGIELGKQECRDSDDG